MTECEMNKDSRSEQPSTRIGGRPIGKARAAIRSKGRLMVAEARDQVRGRESAGHLVRGFKHRYYHGTNGTLRGDNRLKFKV